MSRKRDSLILSDDGTIESIIGEKETEITVGTLVEINFKERGRWYPAKIVNQNSDDTFDVLFDDGEYVYNINKELIRLKNKDNSPNISFDDINNKNDAGEYPKKSLDEKIDTFSNVLSSWPI